MRPLLQSFVTLSLLLVTCEFAASQDAADVETLKSPDGRLQVTFQRDKSGRSIGRVTYREVEIATIAFGLRFSGSPPLQDGLRVVSVLRTTADQSYEIPVGKTSSARDHHNELVVTLEETIAPRRRFELAFRAFDDGLAFRYQIPKGRSAEPFELVDELTQLT